MSKKKAKKISGYPVSYAQRRMWFLSQLESESLLNNTGIIANLVGEIELKYLEKAFRDLVKRHEAFRTNFFQADDGQIIQFIHSAKISKINYYDISNTRKNKIKLQKELIRENTEKRFNLEDDLLIRISLIKKFPLNYCIVITNHHIISDAWALAFFWNELSTLYQAYRKGEKVVLPELTVQYKDYAAWEQTNSFLQKHEQQKKYWLKRLTDAPSLTGLPLDFVRPATQTYNNRSLEKKFEKKTINQIELICAELKVTWYTFFLAMFIVLLQKLSRESDIVVGTYVANRDQSEMERVIGILLNNIAIRTAPDSQKTFRKFIKEVNQVVLDAMKNKEYPFEKLIDELKIRREASHAPIFNTVFQIFNKDTNLLEGVFPDHKKKVEFFNSNFFQHDIVLRIGIEEDMVKFDFNYNADLFNKNSALMMVDAYYNLVNGVVKCLDKKIVDIRLFKAKVENKFKDKTLNNFSENFNFDSKKNDYKNYVDIEGEIIKIWQKVLGVEKINRSDNFFHLGGHSLKLIQVFDQLNSRYPGRVSVAELFNYFTVSSLARHIGRNEAIESGLSIKRHYKKEVFDLLEKVKEGKLSLEKAAEELAEM